MMNRTYRHAAFTLIELLTVIAIITLLIGILTPSLSNARKSAKNTAIKASFAQLSTGCELFKNDHGEYPASNALDYVIDRNSPNTELGDWALLPSASPYYLQGANLLVDALFGRDLLGFDPKPRAAGAQPYFRWNVANARSAPYVEPDQVDFSKDGEPVKDGFGPLLLDEATPKISLSGGLGSMYCPIIIDKWEMPVLYYRADPNATKRTQIVAGGYIGVNNPSPAGVYNGRDNEAFTSHSGVSGSDIHGIHEADMAITTYNDPYITDFVEYIRSFRQSRLTGPTTQQLVRPVNSRSFILLSPGKDGIFNGPDLDDIGNFAIKSEQR